MFNNKADGPNTLKLKPDEREIITTFLRNRAGCGDRRRAAARCRYLDPAGLVVEVAHPGGTIAPHRVMPRDLSELGLGFLHGNFLYPGSGCTVELRGRDGQLHKVPGRIARCDHVTGRVHDVGVEFVKPIDMAAFVDVAVDPESAQPVPAAAEPIRRPSYWRK